jgi:hypothetical protein
VFLCPLHATFPIKIWKFTMSPPNGRTAIVRAREHAPGTRSRSHDALPEGAVDISGASDAPASRVSDATAAGEGLSTRRLNVMRGGYAFMGVGLAITKWPVLVHHAPSLGVAGGVVVCLLTAMSVLALLGLRYPTRMLPILLFEVTWKAIWFAVIGIPYLVSDAVEPALHDVLFNCSCVVIILVVVPWRYAWKRYLRAPGDAWR